MAHSVSNGRGAIKQTIIYKRNHYCSIVSTIIQACLDFVPSAYVWNLHFLVNNVQHSEFQRIYHVSNIWRLTPHRDILAGLKLTDQQSVMSRSWLRKDSMRLWLTEERKESSSSSEKQIWDLTILSWFSCKSVQRLIPLGFLRPGMSLSRWRTKWGEWMVEAWFCHVSRFLRQRTCNSFL